MRLERYPRPNDDTGIGFHYYLDTLHYEDEHARFWIPELKELGASWLTLYAEFDRLVPEAFVKELVENDIEPIIRISVPKVKPLDQGELYRQLKAYAGWGAHYVHVFNEPNLASEWMPEDWCKPALVNRFVDILLPCLERMADAGLYPLFTPLCQGGHYWDTVFLESALEIIIQRNKRSLFDRMAICIHNYASNRPLAWGKGGRAKWTAARPYYCPPGCQDHRGFYLFEWYDEIVRKKVGRSLPLIAGENGLVVGTRNHPSYPIIDEVTHAQRVVEMTRMLMNGELPDHVFNNAFWLLAQGENDRFDYHPWYRNDGVTLSAVDAMKALDKHARYFSWDKREQRAKEVQPSKKPIYHYLLLALSENGVREEALEVVAPYVARFNPTVGFDLEEAKLASRVTLLGGAIASDDVVEKELQSAGCLVDRIDCRGPKDARRILDGMVRRGQRFCYLAE